MDKSRRRYGWWIVLGAALALAWCHFYSKSDESSQGGNGRHGKGANATVPVAVATAKTGDISVYLEGLGNITPRSDVTVHTLVNGQLMKVFFDEGQMVKKNDPLAKIDDRPYIAQLEQAEGALKRDEALLAEAKINLARYQQLWKEDSIAKQQLDAQASLVKQYEGAVLNDRGQVDSAKTNLAYTDITSPVTGRVGLRQVDPGNIVHSTDANGLVVVTELQPITAIFTVPEDSIPSVFQHLNSGTRLPAEAWSRDNKTKLAEGELVAIDNQVDPSTGTVRFRAEFPNEDNALFPSQFVNIHLKLDTLTNVVIVPVAAVQHGTQGAFVYLVKPGNTVAVQAVTLGPGQDDNISVTQGVTAGDQVVVDGTDSLHDGAKIEIAGDGGKTASANGDEKNAKTAPKHRKNSDDNSSDQNP